MQMLGCYPMYAPQGPLRCSSSFLASSVIVIATVQGLLPTLGIPALGLRLHVPEFLTNALFFRRRLWGLLLSVDLSLPCGQITVVLLHKERGVVIQPLECLYIGIAVLFQDAGQAIHPAVDLLLYTRNRFLKGFAFLALEQPGCFSKLLFQFGKLPMHELLDCPGFVLYLDHQLLHLLVFRHIN